MKNPISAFFDNEKFYNPLSEPENKTLLSRKERMKGIVLPHAAQVGLFTATAGMSFLTVGLGATLVVLPAIAAFMTHAINKSVKSYAARLNKIEKHNTFDLSKPEDAIRFVNKFGARHTSFVSGFKKLLKEANLDRNVIVYTGSDENMLAHVSVTDLWGKKPYAIEFGSNVIERTPADELLAVSGHELGHIKLGHFTPTAIISKYLQSYLSTAAVGLAPLAYAAGGIGSVTLGAIFTATALTACHIVKQKISQYHERQADRFTAIHAKDGAASLACHFESELRIQEIYGYVKTSQVSLIPPSKPAFNMSSHPILSQRIRYLRNFEKANTPRP